MTLTESLKTYRMQFILTLLFIASLYHSIFGQMIVDWYKDDNYSHGFLVPIISGYFIYSRRRDLKDALVEPWTPGLLIIILGLIQLTIAWLGTEYFTMRSSLIVVAAGIELFFFGKSIFRILRFPLGYLLFMVPLPYIIYDAVAFPLKLFVTKASVAFLKIIGVAVLREGNIILLPTITLEVVDACSGMRSLVSLIALSVAYAFYSQSSAWKRWIVIISAIPFAIFTNSFRVIITGILAQWWGAKAAEGFFHEFAGFVVFFVAMVLLVALGAVLGERK